MKKKKAVVVKQEAQIVFPRGNGGFTTSLVIADKFEVRHKDVIRKIENLVEKDVNHRLTFKESFYINSQNKKQKMYEMDISGFLFLCLVFKTTETSIEKKITIVDEVSKQIKDATAIAEAIQSIDVDIETKDPLYIYVIVEKYSRRYKIGISKNPQERIKQLQTGNPEPLELVMYYEAKNRFITEKELHEENKDNRLQGEWFSGVPDYKDKATLIGEAIGKTDVPQFQIEHNAPKQIALFGV